MGRTIEAHPALTITASLTEVSVAARVHLVSRWVLRQKFWLAIYVAMAVESVVYRQRLSIACSTSSYGGSAVLAIPAHSPSSVYDSLIRDRCDGLIQTHLRIAAAVVTV
ncbi:hypothetical protein [Rhodococcus sp. BE178]|uniref:hypothetical protein n=1 Tax=Rhodococcus sp. BE178 TaxID=2817737 RepID=UPI003D227743